MPEIIKHKEGMFSYSDLSTTDLDAATTFYTDLFGWKVEDVPMGDGPDDIYRMFTKSGQSVCAASKQREEQAAQGMPPMWNVYFTVNDVDLKAKEAEAAGGTVHVQPFDVFEAGRMAVIADPAGGFFCLWQEKENIGASVMNEANTLDWAEAGSTDVAKAREFYTQVLGWTYEEMDMGEGKAYTVFSVDGKNCAGMMETEMPMSYWSIYFRVDDCKNMADRAQSMGAKVMFGPDSAPGVGTFAVLADPQGAMFGIIQPDSTD